MAEKAARKEFTLEDGTPCSRSAYIRQEFQKDRARKDIAEELGVKYYIVYSATANMFNKEHPEGGSTGGRGAVSAKVDKDFNFVDEDGNIVEKEEDAAQEVRADIMRELFSEGVTRGEIKDHFDVPYATVYAATKDIEPPEGTVRGGKKTIEHPETGEEVDRAEYIKELYQDGEGMTRREIAKHLTEISDEFVDYSAVWLATKKDEEKEEEEEVVEE